MSLEDRILKSMGSYNKQYVDSTNALAKETGNNSLSKGYEDGLKEVLKLKLDEYGYDLEDIELNGANINNIKIKEKNNSAKVIVVPMKKIKIIVLKERKKHKL